LHLELARSRLYIFASPSSSSVGDGVGDSVAELSSLDDASSVGDGVGDSVAELSSRDACASSGDATSLSVESKRSSYVDELLVAGE